MDFEGKWATFYQRSRKTLEGRDGFDESCLPLLERYVFVTKKIAEVQEQMAAADATVKHTNNKEHTNEATNPLIRIFVILNKESLSLAKELELTPAAMKGVKVEAKPDAKKGFETGPMRVSAK